MQQMWNEAFDDVGGFVFFALCLVILVVLGLVALLLWMLISGVVLVVRYQLAYGEAGRLYQQIEDEVGAGYEVDSILRSVFGDGVKMPRDGYHNTVDWLENTILGEERGRAA